MKITITQESDIRPASHRNDLSGRGCLEQYTRAGFEAAKDSRPPRHWPQRVREHALLGLGWSELRTKTHTALFSQGSAI